MNQKWTNSTFYSNDNVGQHLISLTIASVPGILFALPPPPPIVPPLPLAYSSAISLFANTQLQYTTDGSSTLRTTFFFNCYSKLFLGQGRGHFIFLLIFSYPPMVNTHKLCPQCGPVETRYSNCPRCWGPVSLRRSVVKPPVHASPSSTPSSSQSPPSYIEGGGCCGQ